MKNKFSIIFLLIFNVFYAQINQHINKTSGIVTYSISTIDSLIVNNNNNTLIVYLNNQTTESHFLSEILNFTFSMPEYPNGTTFCNGIPTAVVDVLNPITGRIWMDRNLGASQVATSSNDFLAYGDLYQWGRGADGHQCRNSLTSTILSNNDNPLNNNFILSNSTSTSDWRNPANDNLWQGINGINNPCPDGYRIPTELELIQEAESWNNISGQGAFNSPTKFTLTGYRKREDGIVTANDFYAGYWSSTILGNISKGLGYINSGWTGNPTNSSARANGHCIRCIKN